MIKVRLRAVARQDLIDRYVYLSEYASSEIANRFLNAAEASFADLAAQPAMGVPQRLRMPELTGMRKWRVKGFETVLIFYFNATRWHFDRPRSARRTRLVGPARKRKLATAFGHQPD